MNVDGASVVVSGQERQFAHTAVSGPATWRRVDQEELSTDDLALRWPGQCRTPDARDRQRDGPALAMSPASCKGPLGDIAVNGWSTDWLVYRGPLRTTEPLEIALTWGMHLGGTWWTTWVALSMGRWIPTTDLPEDRAESTQIGTQPVSEPPKLQWS